MDQKDFLAKIEKLEARIKELEMRGPVIIINQPPVAPQYPFPYMPQPIYPWYTGPTWMGNDTKVIC